MIIGSAFLERGEKYVSRNTTGAFDTVRWHKSGGGLRIFYEGTAKSTGAAGLAGICGWYNGGSLSMEPFDSFHGAGR